MKKIAMITRYSNEQGEYADSRYSVFSGKLSRSVSDAKELLNDDHLQKTLKSVLNYDKNAKIYFVETDSKNHIELWHNGEKIEEEFVKNLINKSAGIIDMGEVNGMRLSYSNGNVFATPKKSQ